MRYQLPLAISVLAAASLAQTTVFANAAPRAAASIVAGSEVGAPSLRMWGGSATDGAFLYNFGGRLVNSAGTAQGTYFNGLDAYDPATNTWANLSADGAAGAPSDRFRVAFGYDPTMHRLVSFGGLTAAGGTILSDCWVFDLTTNMWSQIPNPTPGTSGPVATMDAKLCYDAASSAMVLFGGSTTNANSTSIADTWMLFGNTWVAVTGLTPGVDSPAARRMHAMCERGAPYNDIVVVGGRDTSNGRWNDTWRWDGSTMTWQEIVANGSTVPVTSCDGNEMVHDTVRDVLVIIGGPGTNVAPSNITAAGGWNSEYDNQTNTWRAFGNDTANQASDDPLIGNPQRFCCEFLNGKTYFWAGQNPPALGDANLQFVKEYQADPIGTATAYGAGCAGPGGVLTLTPNNGPWTGRTFSATCTNIGGPLAMTIWGINQSALPLAAVLPQAGAGCLLLNDATLLLGPDVVAGGSITASLPLPYNAGLAGSVLNVQVAELEFDLSFSWVGLYTSNGLELTVGEL